MIFAVSGMAPQRRSLKILLLNISSIIEQRYRSTEVTSPCAGHGSVLTVRGHLLLAEGLLVSLLFWNDLGIQCVAGH